MRGGNTADSGVNPDHAQAVRAYTNRRPPLSPGADDGRGCGVGDAAASAAGDVQISPPDADRALCGRLLLSGAELIIELDGGVHAPRTGRDARRDQWLTAVAGFTVLRFANEAILNNPALLFNAVRQHAASRH